MTKVFVGGSRHVSRLEASVRARLDRIITKDLPVVLGDANGADKAVQQYLHSKNYRNVEVFCSGDVCRNNIGRWDTRPVAAGSRSRGFAFFAAKDREMARQASFGLMIWDGSSIGTILNVLRLLRQDKKVVVYHVPDKAFSELTAFDQWPEFISRYGSELRTEIDARLTPEDLDESNAPLPILAALP